MAATKEKRMHHRERGDRRENNYLHVFLGKIPRTCRSAAERFLSNQQGHTEFLKGFRQTQRRWLEGETGFAPRPFGAGRRVAGRVLGTALFTGMLLLSAFGAVHGRELRLLFTGDIMLSRQVQVEIERTRRSPWDGWPQIFQDADWVVGNFEGAVGPAADCHSTSERSPCFAVSESFIPFLRRAGFRAFGIANNHSGDLGDAGRAATRSALVREGLRVFSFEDSPTFVRFDGITVAVVAFSMVAGPDGQRVEVPSPALRQKLRLARRLANMVVVSVHWGNELLDWPVAEQRRAAHWLVSHGADIIIGHHPHVVQPLECIQGKAVFFSLGNHVFDQKYPATKEGAVADCRVADGRLTCGTIATRTPPGSAFPQLLSANGNAGEPWPTRGESHPGKVVRHPEKNGIPSDPLVSRHKGEGGETGGIQTCSEIANTHPDAVTEKALPKPCPPTLLGPGFDVAGYALHPVPADSARGGMDGEWVLEAVKDGKVQWKTRPVRLLAIDAGRLAGPGGPEMLLTLERHPSPLDREDGPRPYVYEATSRGLIARWRGTALAWPVLDIVLLPGETATLCALHRGDSFLVPDPRTSRTRVAAYRWNGFGFSGFDDPAAVDRCAEMFDLPANFR